MVQPSKLLDVGGSATEKRVVEAFKIILSDQNVKAVLVNIFGGIVRCDMIADGIINAIRSAEVKVPVIVRLEGNQAQMGHSLLEQSELGILAATSLKQAVTMAIEAAEDKA